MIDALLITCEHGGNSVPPRWRPLFRGHRALLDSHRGWDPGALPIARALAREMNAPLIYSTISRLLVELNRSPHHRVSSRSSRGRCPRSTGR
jgi:predicted N-formylglutamate amidohydrolase